MIIKGSFLRGTRFRLVMEEDGPCPVSPRLREMSGGRPVEPVRAQEEIAQGPAQKIGHPTLNTTGRWPMATLKLHQNFRHLDGRDRS